MAHPSDSVIPFEAVPVGCEADGKPLYIGRVFYRASVHVGSVGKHLNGMMIACAGHEEHFDQYEVLCTARPDLLRWVDCTSRMSGEDYRRASEQMVPWANNHGMRTGLPTLWNLVDAGIDSNGHKFEWVPCENGAVPHRAVQGGAEADGVPLYVGRGEHKGGMHVGKVSPQHGGLLISYGTKEIKLKRYEVLTGDASQLRWVVCHGQAMPDGWVPVEGGWEEDGQKLFVAKVQHAGGLHVGKAGPHLYNGVSFAYDSKELTAESYWVLVHL
ncbi:hypothetical protein THASP1DRAFT_28859 [Thamnocephalis sphaerospora]|uniref:Uncharacterized protein n=1 Tax=Thamnocephalis sphaerospora TaxID=78915 RepID=A0A4P9XT43_9FUNG|nr:hypothetical protein THASP1DRAFT_28859 [Thamnocephalis sphaerospora]|eukprot:RKP09335.1 hypothetical protein THASP1DRAFT_28859 [Thamnocephalis sphaerospora]